MKIVSCGEGWALHLCYQAATTPHAMRAMKILIPVDGTLSLRAAGGAVQQVREPVLVPPLLVHEVGCSGLTLAAFLEPDGAHRSLLPSFGEAPVLLSGARGERLRAAAAAGVWSLAVPAAAEETLRALCAPLDVSARLPLLDGRVEAARRLVAERCLAGAPTPSLEEIARRARLSPCHAARLFHSQVGMAPRAYGLWCRAFGVVARFAAAPESAPTTAGELAHASGFSDLAHMTRTARRMFGQPANYLSHLQHRVGARTFKPASLS